VTAEERKGARYAGIEALMKSRWRQASAETIANLIAEACRAVEIAATTRLETTPPPGGRKPGALAERD